MFGFNKSKEEITAKDIDLKHPVISYNRRYLEDTKDIEKALYINIQLPDPPEWLDELITDADIGPRDFEIYFSSEQVWLHKRYSSDHIYLMVTNMHSIHNYNAENIEHIFSPASCEAVQKAFRKVISSNRKLIDQLIQAGQLENEGVPELERAEDRLDRLLLNDTFADTDESDYVDIFYNSKKQLNRDTVQKYIFEYNGYHFVPLGHRLKDIDSYFLAEFTVFAEDKQDMPFLHDYDYDRFRTAAHSSADTFQCIETGGVYVPFLHELSQIVYADDFMHILNDKELKLCRKWIR